MQAASGYAGLVRPDEVHHRVYTDPQVFDAEMDRIFGRTWVFVGHESEIPRPGSFKTELVGARRPLLLVRDRAMRVHAFYNVCRHRGAKLCQDEYGTASSFMCLYHGWTYDTDGRFLGAPLQKRMRNFDPAAQGLVEVPRLACRRGFIFASLASDGASLDDHLGRAGHYIDMMVDRAPDGEIEAAYPVKYRYDGNWKLQLDNYADNAHAAVLHQVALGVGRANNARYYANAGANSFMERTMPHGHWVGDYRGSRGITWMDAYDDAYLAALERRVGDNRARELLELDLHVLIYPNLLLHTRTNHYRVVRPLRVDHTEVWTYPCRLKGASGRVNEHVIRYASHHTSPMGEIQVDDMQALGWVQEGMASNAIEWYGLRLDGIDEHVNPDGETESIDSSERALRNHFQEWQRLMA